MLYTVSRCLGPLLLAYLLLTGCGGSSDDDTRRNSTSDLNGIYVGSFNNENGEFDLFAMIFEGLIFAYSESGQLQYAGTAQGRHADFFAIYGLFDSQGTHVANAEAQGLFVPHASIDANYLTTDFETGEIALTIDPLWKQAASLSRVAGTYVHTDGAYALTVTIDGTTGQLDGSDTDACLYTGQVLPPKAKRNLYIVDMTQSAGCRGEPEAVDILGYATLVDNDPNPDELFTLSLAEGTASNQEFMWTLHLLRQ